MSEEIKKKVDESWKDEVTKEKSGVGSEAGPQGAIEMNFSLYISGLMMEGMVALGEIEHPVSKKKEFNPIHSKLIIDTLGILEEKTKNNLTNDESQMLDAILYELRMRFLNLNQKKDK